MRANGIGDFMFALPALSALRHAYPQAEIVLIGAPWHANFLPARTVVDRVVVAPGYPGVRDDVASATPGELDQFFAAMAAERFDIAIQMHGGGRNSNPFVSRLGAKLTVGFRDLGAPPLDRWMPYFYYQNEYSRYLELMGLIGVEPAGAKGHLSVLPDDLTAASAFLDSEKPFAILNPGASDPRRRWPPERFAQVGDWFRERGMAVLVSGGPDEVDIAEQVVSFMRKPSRSIAGQTSLGELLGLLSRAEIVVSNDTGPLHLAVSIDTPSIGIYWCGNMVNASPGGRRRHMPVVSWMVDCPNCGEDIATYSIPPRKSETCEHAANFTERVPADQVIAAAMWLFGDIYD